MTFEYETFLLGKLLGTSMSEKKSVSGIKLKCTICEESSSDFLELDDWSDSCFILCANCEAVSTSEDLYGVNYDDEYAYPRESPRRTLRKSCI